MHCYTVHIIQNSVYMEFGKHFQYSRKKLDRPLRQLTDFQISVLVLSSFTTLEDILLL